MALGDTSVRLQSVLTGAVEVTALSPPHDLMAQNAGLCPCSLVPLVLLEKGTKDEDYLYREISYGSFERRFLLPEGVKTEDLKAKYTNGILEVTVPAPALAKARKIEIETPKEAKQIESEATAKKAA